MILGMDFGTTNSGMAVYDGRTLRPIPLDADGTTVDRTALYITNDHGLTIGQRAIDRYLDQNVGRPVRMERVRVGTIALTLSDIGTLYREVHIEQDILSPGRLFTSVKTFLSSRQHEGTVVGGLSYSMEDLVSAYLRVARLRAERVLDREVRAIVLGRPVAFSRDPAADALAQERLVSAALHAGYETVYLQYEPVAAALQYETTLRTEQIVLVFDFGGGTLDVTVMRIGDPAAREVLATGGIPVAGDVFDQRIVRRKLAPLFGEGSLYGPPARRTPIPAWIYDALCDWQSIVTLQQPDNRAVLEEIAATAERPQQLHNLIELAARNYGLALYRAVEVAKRALSEAADATIRFEGATFTLREGITQQEFAALIRDETHEVEKLLLAVVRDAGLSLGDVDAVVRTGGSSQIPVFVALLQRLFGAEKVRDVDLFSGVTAGLAVAAQRIEAGEMDAREHRRARPGEEAAGNTVAAPELRAPAVTPRFLADWVTAQEEIATAPNPCAALAWLTPEYRLLVAALPSGAEAADRPVALSGALAGAATALRPVLVGLDDRLALITSAYRVLLATPRRLLLLEDNGLRLTQVHGFGDVEVVSALGPWESLRARPRLGVVSGRGLLRMIDVERMRGRLERSIPFSLEAPPESDPVAMASVEPEQELVIVTADTEQRARALRIDPHGVSARGVQALKLGKDERIVGCVAAHADDRLLLVGDDGTARLVPLDGVPVAALHTATRAAGKVVATRFAVCGAMRHDPTARLWLLTTCYLRPAAADYPPASSRPGRPFTLATLEPDERVIGLVGAW